MRALFAGSFDPPTYGHLNMIERASLLFSRVFVGIAKNSNKKNPLLTDENKLTFLKQACKAHTNVEVIAIEGLTVDWAKHNEIDLLIRGIRTSADFEFEYALADANRKLTGIETFFMPAEPKYASISSSILREIAQGGYSLKEFVPPEVEYLLTRR